MIKTPVPARADLDKGLKKTYFDMAFVTEDNAAHQIDVQLFRGKQAAQLESGASVSAYFIRYIDNATIMLDGSVSGSIASVTLKKACYNRSGAFALIIKVLEGGVVNTVFYGEGTILASKTDTILDEENVIPSLDDLLAQITVMEQAIEDANTATENATTAAGAANTAAGRADTSAAAIEGMTVSAESGGSAAAEIREENGVKHIAFTLPKGDKGDKGDKGEPGQNGTGSGTVTGVTVNGTAHAPDGTGMVTMDIDAERVGAMPADNWLDKIYPVGSIYMSTNDTSPAALFGGVWEQIKGRFLLGAGANEANPDGSLYAGEVDKPAGQIGGEASVLLSRNNIPPLALVTINSSGAQSGYAPSITSGNYIHNTGKVNADITSENQWAVNNMPPYLAVYIWKRLADDTEVAA